MPNGWPIESPSGEYKDPPPRNGSHSTSSPSTNTDSSSSNQTANGRYVRHENGGRGSGDIELAREPWEGRGRGSTGDGDVWDSKENLGGGMGAKIAKAAAVGRGEDGAGRYEVVEREEPLLEAENHVNNGERYEAFVLNGEIRLWFSHSSRCVFARLVSVETSPIVGPN